ncbi:MAG: NAD-binding protein [Ruthenibacterium lactatiformans]
MCVCIVGGGKVGYYLAKTLLEHGHTPVLIEDDPAMCRKVADSLDLTVCAATALLPKCRKVRTWLTAAPWLR